ncbi:MAG: hypothetical protein WAQ98_27895 [Blastocatellia bacterium]
MKLIKFPLSSTKGKEISLPNNTRLTDNIENVITSLPYQDWEIEEIIENLSETEQDALIEKISDQVQEWELTLDANLELWLQTKHKESKSNISYIDFLYDLAQEQVYRAYAIEKLNEQKNKASLVGSNNSANDKPLSFPTSNNQAATTTATTTAATPTELSANQTANNLNCLLNDEEQQINQIIEKLSEVEQDTLMEKTVFLFDQWELTTDEGLKLALKMQHQKSQPNIPYQDFLYELAQSQVYREYAIEQLELAKQSSFAFIEPFTQIEKVYCDKANSVDELTFDEPVFNNVSQDANNVGVQLLEANNHTTNNDDRLATNSNDAFIREESFSNKISLDHYQANVGDNQGHQEILTSLKDCTSHHIIKTSPNGYRKLTTKYIDQQSSNFALANYSWKNSLPLTKTRKALLIPINQGKLANFYHPPSLPP